jgi:hypothetical protein
MRDFIAACLKEIPGEVRVHQRAALLNTYRNSCVKS